MSNIDVRSYPNSYDAADAVDEPILREFFEDQYMKNQNTIHFVAFSQDTAIGGLAAVFPLVVNPDSLRIASIKVISEQVDDEVAVTASLIEAAELAASVTRSSIIAGEGDVNESTKMVLIDEGFELVTDEFSHPYLAKYV